MIYDILRRCTGFDWDDGNATKNWDKHAVTQAECEQIFLNAPLIVAPDVRHSEQERRYFALGRTDLERRLFVVFTLRGDYIRVISARDMNKQERKAYDR